MLHENDGAHQENTEDEEDSVLQLWHQPEHTPLWSDPALRQDSPGSLAELAEANSSMDSDPRNSSEEGSAAAETESEAADMHAHQHMLHAGNAAPGQWAQPHPSHAAVARAAAARLGSAADG